MCGTCKCEIKIPSEICAAQQQQAVNNALERLERMKTENVRLKTKTAIEKERGNQEQVRLNYEQSKTQSDAEKFNLQQHINTEKIQQTNQQLSYEREKTQSLIERLNALAGVDKQKTLQASQDFEFSQLETEYQSQKYLTQAKEWEVDMAVMTKHLEQKKQLVALKYGC